MSNTPDLEALRTIAKRDPFVRISDEDLETLRPMSHEERANWITRRLGREPRGTEVNRALGLRPLDPPAVQDPTTRGA